MKFTSICKLLTGAALLAAGAAQASTLSAMYVFGDSLSDAGNNTIVLGGPQAQVVTGNSYIPTFTYAPSGTYSNGSVWATGFGSAMGMTVTPSLAGGTNRAFGGARTAVTPSMGFPPSVAAQVSGLLTARGGVLDSEALYVVAGGGNDARDTLNNAAMIAGAGGNPSALIAAAAAQYAMDVGLMVDSLQGAGVKYIVVWNTPNLGLAPAVTVNGAGIAGLGTGIASAMNLALAARLASEVDVISFDLFGLLTDVVARPAMYGMGNVTDACGAIMGCDPATALFWDGIHPTSGGHALLVAAMQAAVPEPAALWLVAGALGLLLVQRRRA